MRRSIPGIILVAAFAFACGGSASGQPPPTGPAAPPAPAGLQAKNGNGSVTLTWAAVDGATSYLVFRSVINSPETQVGTSTSASFVDTTALNGNPYSYTVRAVSAAGTSADSAATEAEPFRQLCASDSAFSRVMLFNAEASNVTVAQRSFGSSTGITGLSFTGLAIDPAHGEIFSAGAVGDTVTSHAMNADGNVAPVRTLLNVLALGVTYDGAADDVIVVSQPPIVTYARTANGNDAPIRTLEPPFFMRKAVLSGAAHGDRMFTSSAGGRVDVFGRTDSGKATPASEIAPVGAFFLREETLLYDPASDDLLEGTAQGVEPGVAAFSSASNGPMAVTRFLHGDQTGLTSVTALALDAAHELLYVADASGQVLTFPAGFGADANLAPTSILAGQLTQITGTVLDLAFDAAHAQLVVRTGTRILTFDAAAHGNVAPLRAISSASAGVETPVGIAFDRAHGEILIADGDAQPAVAAFNAAADGPATVPLRTLPLPSTGPSASSVFVDAAHGELIAASSNPPRIAFYGLGASGDASPLRVIAGSKTGLLDILDVALDEVHDAVVVQDGGNIRRFARTFADGNEAPLTSVVDPGFLAFDGDLNFQGGLSVDNTHGEVFVSDVHGVTVFGLTDDGAAQPTRTLTIPNSARGVWVDPIADQLFVITNNGSRIEQFNRTASGTDQSLHQVTAEVFGKSILLNRLTVCN